MGLRSGQWSPLSPGAAAILLHFHKMVGYRCFSGFQYGTMCPLRGDALSLHQNALLASAYMREDMGPCQQKCILSAPSNIPIS